MFIKSMFSHHILGLCEGKSQGFSNWTKVEESDSAVVRSVDVDISLNSFDLSFISSTAPTLVS